MQMMYETIYKALVEVGLEDAFSPQDFLNFYCLGNREAFDSSNTSNDDSHGAANTPQVLCFCSILSSFSMKSQRKYSSSNDLLAFSVVYYFASNVLYSVLVGNNLAFPMLLLDR